MGRLASLPLASRSMTEQRLRIAMNLFCAVIGAARRPIFIFPILSGFSSLLLGQTEHQRERGRGRGGGSGGGGRICRAWHSYRADRAGSEEKSAREGREEGAIMRASSEYSSENDDVLIRQ